MKKAVFTGLVAVSILATTAWGGKVKQPQREPPRGASGAYEYQAVVDAPGTQAELYSRALAWAATTYRSAQHAVQLTDPETATVVIKGSFIGVKYMLGTSIPVLYTLTVEAKDQRYRYTLGQIIVDRGHWQEPLESMSSPSAKFRDGIDGRARDVLASLEAAMKTKPANW